MSCLSSKRVYLVALLSITIMVIFATIGQKNVLAGEVVHSFYLPSILKQGTDVYPREVRFIAKYPGVIEADASWEPVERELTITLYDQEGKPLASKKGVSPVHLDYTYTLVQLNKAKILGNTLTVGVSQSPFKTINGSIKIRIPDKIAIEEDNSINVRGPFGTFKEEKVEEE
jgi:hypothetical protein